MDIGMCVQVERFDDKLHGFWFLAVNWTFLMRLKGRHFYYFFMCPEETAKFAEQRFSTKSNLTFRSNSVK